VVRDRSSRVCAADDVAFHAISADDRWPTTDDSTNLLCPRVIL